MERRSRRKREEENGQELVVSVPCSMDPQDCLETQGKRILASQCLKSVQPKARKIKSKAKCIS